jgi:hypothetical protein
MPETAPVILIKGAKIVNEDCMFHSDVLVENGLIRYVIRRAI